MIHFEVNLIDKKTREFVDNMICSMRDDEDMLSQAYFYFGMYVANNIELLKRDIELRVVEIRYSGYGKTL